MSVSPRVLFDSWVLRTRHVYQQTGLFIVDGINEKAAKRLHGYFIRITRGGADGGMDSSAEVMK
jgi:hypothetical protein